MTLVRRGSPTIDLRRGPLRRTRSARQGMAQLRAGPLFAELVLQRRGQFPAQARARLQWGRGDWRGLYLEAALLVLRPLR